MSATEQPAFDFIAVGPHGVYAICSDIPGDPNTRSFIAATISRGHRVERVPVAEAVERHKAFLAMAVRDWIAVDPHRPDALRTGEEVAHAAP